MAINVVVFPWHLQDKKEQGRQDLLRYFRQQHYGMHGGIAQKLVAVAIVAWMIIQRRI